MDATMVVCNVYKLFKDGKSYTKVSKKLTRGKIILSRKYVEEKNANWETNGLWHEELEDVTLEYIEMSKNLREKKKSAKKVEKHLRDTLTDVIEQDMNVDDELEELKKDYIDKFGKKPFYKWGIKELKEKLDA